jgi:hypothetical protein
MATGKIKDTGKTAGKSELCRTNGECLGRGDALHPLDTTPFPLSTKDYGNELQAKCQMFRCDPISLSRQWPNVCRQLETRQRYNGSRRAQKLSRNGR